MSLRALLANSAWALGSLPAWIKFKKSLQHPEETQLSILSNLIRRSATTAFGKAHSFDQIRTYKDFAAVVPIRNYEGLEPWIDRIRRGEKSVLSHDPVQRLVPTSGTSGAAKLIPYTASLQHEFNNAVGPWMVDLFRSDPRLLSGSAYWSISPAIQDDRSDTSAVPIGFADDSEYLGRIRSTLVNWILTVPASVRLNTNIEQFQKETFSYLKLRSDLRLISIWHPSFLPLLLKHQPADPKQLWPALRLISCWTDAQAAGAAEELARQFPGVRIQPKGLIATEAIISIPFQDHHPLAITSHFLEFLDEGGSPHLAHELHPGKQYSVIITTGGGLWRYRLNDLIRVERFLGKTPSIRFIGKAGNISDLFGEKLSEAFVSQVLERLRQRQLLDGSFAMLAPQGNRYVLYARGAPAATALSTLEQELRENPHYAYCRDLGQLAAPALFRIADDCDPHAAVILRHSAQGQRMGDIKPGALSRLVDWDRHFTGALVS